MYTDYSLLLDNIGEAVLMLDKEGFIVYSNQITGFLTGYTEEDLLNKPLSVLYENPRDNAVKADYELRQAVKKGRFISEGWRAKKDGSAFWAEATLSPVYDQQYVLAGYSCLLRDVHERRELESGLRQREERYRLMVEGVRDYAIFMLDATGHILTWNEGARRTKGYTVNEIIGKHFSVFYTLEDKEDGKPERELKIAVETGKYEEEGWRVRKNGSVFWANVVITALFNEQNKLIGFSKVTRDLTERRQNEESLRQSEERYRSLVEQVIDYGILMLDEKGRIISWNEGARKIKGYTAEEIIGKYFSIFYPQEDILNGKPANELKIASTKGTYEEEGWRVRKDGSLFWANVVITAIYSREKVLIGFTKVTRDLTERKESEKVLRESYERYRQLTEELRSTNTHLSHANEELEQFTSIVSHDLQEPIRTIKSFLTLIDMKLGVERPEVLKAYIGKALTGANRMKELILNLLDYSQLDKEQWIQEEVMVKDLVNEALQNVKTAIDHSQAAITVDISVDRVKGDRVQLLQLVQNIVSNALKFTRAGKPRIQIRNTRENGYVKFAISDNGIGIDKSDHTKVFDIFRRLNTEKEYPGTGIGLAICKKIVDRHGGRIWPESAPGEGTIFYFTLHENIPQQLPAS